MSEKHEGDASTVNRESEAQASEPDSAPAAAPDTAPSAEPEAAPAPDRERAPVPDPETAAAPEPGTAPAEGEETGAGPEGSAASDEDGATEVAPEPGTAPAEPEPAPAAEAEAVSAEPPPSAPEPAGKAAPADEAADPPTPPEPTGETESGSEAEVPDGDPTQVPAAASGPVASTDLEEPAPPEAEEPAGAEPASPDPDQASAETDAASPDPARASAATEAARTETAAAEAPEGDDEPPIEEPADAPPEALETAREAVTAAGEGAAAPEVGGPPPTAAGEEAEAKAADAAPAAAAEAPMPTDEVSLRLLDALEKGTPIQGKVFGWNQGGYHVLIDGLLAFCPRSGIDAGTPKSPKKYIEKTYRFHVVEHRRQGNRFILSRTKLVEEERAKQAARAREKLAVGAELEGRVSSLTGFGAFVDLGGGVEGLVHVSQLAHTNVEQPKDVLKKGQNVKVKVLKIEEEGKRISLSIKALQPDPWKELAASRPRGSEFTGKITGKTDFGVFVEIAEGIEGLVHVSALPPGTTLESEDLEPGKELSGWVKEVDTKRRRVSLSLRPVPTSDPWKGVEERYPEGDAVTGTVEEIAPFGIFINLEPGLTGLMPNSEMKLPRGTNPARVYAPGTEVKVQVAKIEAKRKRLTLVPEGSKVEGSRTDFKEFKKRAQENLGGGMPTLAAAFAKLKGEDDDEEG